MCNILGYIVGNVWNKHIKLYPMIGMNEGKIKVNFGNKKFMFNIEENYQEILKSSGSKRPETPDERSDRLRNGNSSEEIIENGSNEEEEDEEDEEDDEVESESYDENIESDDYVYNESSEMSSMYNSSISEAS